MGADLAIHVLTKDFTEKHLEAFQSSTIGSRWFRWDGNQFERNFEKEHNCNLYHLCSETPHVFVGEASFLKAALFEDSETFIPDTIEVICSIISDNLPIINDELIYEIEKSFNLTNKTQYELSESNDVIEFLKKHKGQKAFTIAW